MTSGPNSLRGTRGDELLLQDNLDTVAREIAAMQVPLQEAMAHEYGSPAAISNLQSEIDKLEAMQLRIEKMLRDFSVTEPVDTTYVEDLVDRLRVADIQGQHPSWFQQAEMLDAAAEASREAATRSETAAA